MQTTMLEDYFHVEGECLKYLIPPKDILAHRSWFNMIHDKLNQFQRDKRNPRDYILIQLIDESRNKPESKLIWRHKNHGK